MYGLYCMDTCRITDAYSRMQERCNIGGIAECEVVKGEVAEGEVVEGEVAKSEAESRGVAVADSTSSGTVARGESSNSETAAVKGEAKGCRVGTASEVGCKVADDIPGADGRIKGGPSEGSVEAIEEHGNAVGVTSRLQMDV